MMSYRLFPPVLLTSLITLNFVICEWRDHFVNTLKQEFDLHIILQNNVLAISVYLNEQRFLKVINMHTDSVFMSQVLQELHTRRHVTITVATFEVNSKKVSNAFSHLACEHCTNETVSYLLLVDNEVTLTRHLNEMKSSHMILNFRSRFLIVFTSNYSVSLIHPTQRYRRLLDTLWKKHRIIHAYITHTYENNSQKTVSDLVFYEPFLRVNKKQFGQVHTVDFRIVHSLNQLENKRFIDMNGHPFKISVFDRLSLCFGMTFVKMTKTCLGFDGFVLSELAKYMNFTPIIRQPTTLKDFGHYYSNGTSTGLIGDVLQGRADIAFNLFFVKHYGTQQVAFTNQVRTDELCVVVQKSKEIPKWLTMLSTFESDLFAVIMAVYITFALILILFKKLRLLYRQECDKRIDVVYLFLDTFHPVMNMSITQLSPVTSQRILATCTLVLGLILVSAFQSKLVATIGHKMYYKDIDTLKQLDESGLMITTNSKDMKDTFSGSEYSFMHRLTSKIVERNADLSTLGQDGNVATFVRKSLAQLKWHYFRSADGEEILHLVKECPRSYYLAYILPKVSPYLKRITNFLDRLLESGILDHWEAKINQYNKISRLPVVTGGRALKVFNLVDLQLPFYVLSIGLLIASMTFLFERLH